VGTRIIRILVRKKLPKATHAIQRNGVIDLIGARQDFEQVEVRFVVWIEESGVSLEVIERQCQLPSRVVARVFLDDAILWGVALLVQFYEVPYSR
jgi:hypothetical protein